MSEGVQNLYRLWCISLLFTWDTVIDVKK